MMKFKSLFRRGQSGGSNKNSAPGGSSSSSAQQQQQQPAPILRGASSVSSLDSKHHKSGAPSAPVVTGLSTTGRTGGRFAAGSRDKLDKLGARDKLGSRDRLDKLSSRDRGLDKLGAREKLVDGRRQQQEAVNNNLQQQRASRIEPTRQSGSHHHQQPVSVVTSGDVGVLIAPPDLASREFQSLPYDHHFGTAEMIHQLQGPGPAEIKYQAAMQELDSIRHQLESSSQQRRLLESSLEEQRVQHGAELQALQHALEALREQNAELNGKLLQVQQQKEQEEEERRQDGGDVGGDGGGAGGGAEERVLLQVPQQQQQKRLHSSAPASIAVSNSQDDQTLATACPTPDWDKHSSTSLNEVSVACLQVKIHEMEETHHSTNEELQATLQELSDLQSQLTELQTDNERLNEEKGALYQSLCQSENLLKQEDIEVNDLRKNLEDTSTEKIRLGERLLVLEGSLDAANADKKQLEMQLQSTRDESSEREIEISRLSTLLENAKTKIMELESDRDRASDSTDLGELLSCARREKDDLRAALAGLQEQLAKSQCEAVKLRDQVDTLQEECKVMRNNAKCALSDLQYQYEQLQQEKHQLMAEMQMQQETFSGFQAQNQHLAEECHKLQTTVADSQRELREAEVLLQQEQRMRKEEHADWEQFQTDLLMTVRVANNFKLEAQEQIEQLKVENEGMKNYILDLECKVDKMKVAKSAVTTTTAANTNATAEILPKPTYVRQDSRVSVKNLVEDIEKAQKPKQLTNVDKTGSTNSSTSSLNSLTYSNTTDIIGSISPTIKENNWADAMFQQNNQTSGTGFIKNPLREQPQQKYQFIPKGNQTPLTPKTSMKLYNTHPDVVAGGPTYAYLKNNFKSAHSKSQDDPNSVASLLSQKNLDYARRNSYGDQSEKKDPLNALYINGGSKRNALLKWCQEKTVGYRNIDITNFSSSWNDGLAFCAILHTYLPDRIPYNTLSPNEKKRNFSLAFAAAESVGIQTSLNINDMIQLERPDWHQVMAYVIAIYKHFEI